VDRVVRIRQKIIQLSYEARSGHLGSSLSCVEMLDAILSVSNLRPSTVSDPSRDRIILSKGHAAMAYYATLEAWGLLPAEALTHYLENGSALWGHVTRVPEFPAIDYSTGSLGHGLGMGVGHAMGYRLLGHGGRVFVLLSDGECNEGSVWESAWFAADRRLPNLTVLVDCNGLQGLGPCAPGMTPDSLVDKWRSFGWKAESVDGHDVKMLRAKLSEASDFPRALLCRTIKGKGIPEIENTVASHYLPAEQKYL